MELQRDNLTRSVPFRLERATEDGDGLTLEGYGAVFDTPTRIDSWEGVSRATAPSSTRRPGLTPGRAPSTK